jgi:translation initiation factor 5B
MGRGGAAGGGGGGAGPNSWSSECISVRMPRRKPNKQSDEEDEQLVEIEHDTVDTLAPPKPKFAFLDLEESNDEEEQPQDEPEEQHKSESEEEEPVQAKGKAKAKKNKKEQKKKDDDEEDLDAILAQFSGKPASAPADANEGEKKSKKDKKKNKKKNKKDKDSDDELELLAAGGKVVSESKQETEQVDAAPSESKEGARDAEEDKDADLKDSDEAQKLTKAQLKRLKQKAKKAEKDKQVDAPASQPAVVEPSEDKQKKPSKGIAALKAKLEKERLEQERLEREYEEKLKRQEEERLRQIEEEKRLAEERERKKLQKKENQKLAAEEREKQKKLMKKQEMMAFAKAQGIQISAFDEAASTDKKKKPVFAKKKPNKGPSHGLKEEIPAFQESNETPSLAAEVKKAPIVEEVKPSVPEPVSVANDVSESSESDVPDSWDIDSDEERQRKEEKERRRAEKAAKKLAAIENAKKETPKEVVIEEKKTVKKDKDVPTTLKNNDEAGNAWEDEEKVSFTEAQREKLRSPICCILGHVDTGKTKILDKIRSTNVQDKEAGGITQQIGASFFPMSSIEKQTAELNNSMKKKPNYYLPGLLVIDTPGHESFTNLRSRGSSLCDIAILVVDLMHGLEPQTIESINLLKSRKTPFIVALNKVDRVFDWEANPWSPFQVSYKKQKKYCQQEFEDRWSQIRTQFAEQGLNTELYFRNKDFKKVVSIVPTSAHTGEGLPDLLMLLVQLCQKMMDKRLQFISSLQCTVLEVKQVSGLGTTLDVVLSNGSLNRGDQIVVCGMNGPIVTKIRALLTPAPLSEMRASGVDYVQLQTVKASAGIRIAAPDLDDAIAGSELLVVGPKDNIENIKDEVMQDLSTVLSRVDKSGLGVCVQASSIGSLEALLSFLEDMKIPVSGISIGPVHKRDVIRASVMVEKKPELALILAFDVPVSKDAQAVADDRGVKIFTAKIIYHLFDSFTKHMKAIEEEKMAKASEEVVFPVIMQILSQHIIRKSDPIILGCKVKNGILRIGTPICVPDSDVISVVWFLLMLF